VSAKADANGANLVVTNGANGLPKVDITVTPGVSISRHSYIAKINPKTGVIKSTNGTSVVISPNVTSGTIVTTTSRNREMAFTIDKANDILILTRSTSSYISAYNWAVEETALNQGRWQTSDNGTTFTNVPQGPGLLENIQTDPTNPAIKNKYTLACTGTTEGRRISMAYD
jgi:hypothetical protein